MFRACDRFALWRLCLALGGASLIVSGPDNLAHAQEAAAVVASEELLIGAWDVDNPALIDSMRAQLSPEEAEMVLALMEGSAMRTVYRSDGTASLTADGPGFESNSVATWVTVRAEGNQLTLVLVEDKGDGQPPTPETFTVTFETPDRMVMLSQSEPIPVPFVRGVEDPAEPAVAAPSAPAAPVELPPPHPVTGLPVEQATSDNLVGEWSADVPSMVAAEAATMSQEELAMTLQMLASVAVTFSFSADGSAVVTLTEPGASETIPSTWQVLSTAGNTLRFVLTEVPPPGTGIPTPETFTATFLSENNVTLVEDGGGRVIPLYRQ